MHIFIYLFKIVSYFDEKGFYMSSNFDIHPFIYLFILVRIVLSITEKNI